MTLLLIKNLKKSFKSSEILKGVSFGACQGDVIALMGSSGSGKSTLLRCINQLEVADGGQISINDTVFDFEKSENGRVNKPSSQALCLLRSQVGMVFQSFNLWPHMTALENLIEAPIHVQKRDKKTVINEAVALLEKVGLANKQNAYPVQLSGGQQQRVAIARALMMKPKIMLFDEPTSALDPETVNEVLDVLRNLAKDDGMTLLIASHEISFIREIATKAIFLEQGKILEQGGAKDIFLNPKSERIKQFLASAER